MMSCPLRLFVLGVELDGEFSTQGADLQRCDFSYNGLSAGSHSITATATDSSGLTTAQTFALVVNTLRQRQCLAWFLPVLYRATIWW